MIRTRMLFVLSCTLAVGFGARCADEDVTGTTENVIELAEVEDVAVSASPSRIQVLASGNLEDSCTAISEIDVARTGNVFNVFITTRRPVGAICAQVLAPFNETIVLDPDGLPAGNYRVDVNGVEESFTIPAG